MISLNPAGADTRLLADSGYAAGFCLQHSAVALGAVPSLMGHTTANAKQAWDEGTKNVAKQFPTLLGTPGFFSGAGGKWDVVLWHGNGTWVGVDTKNGVYHPGVSGVQTTAQRAKQVSGSYQGFQNRFLGYDIVGGLDPAGGGGTVVPTPEEYMAFSFVKDAQADTIFVVSLVSGNRAAIASSYHFSLLQRVKVDNGTDSMLAGELDICRGYLAAINPPPIATAPALPPISISPDSIEAGVRAAFTGGMQVSGTTTGKAVLT